MTLTYGAEICDAICTKYREDTMLQIYILHELYMKTKEDVFHRRINKLCLDNNLCANCYEPLHIHTYQDLVGEFHGQKAYEKRTEMVCERCGK